MGQTRAAEHHAPGACQSMMAQGLCVVREWMLEQWREVMFLRYTGSDPGGLALGNTGKGVHVKATIGTGTL